MIHTSRTGTNQSRHVDGDWALRRVGGQPLMVVNNMSSLGNAASGPLCTPCIPDAVYKLLSYDSHQIMTIRSAAIAA